MGRCVRIQRKRGCADPAFAEIAGRLEVRIVGRAAPVVVPEPFQRPDLTSFETVAERRMRARNDGKAFRGTAPPAKLSIRQASLDALLATTAVSTTVSPGGTLPVPAVKAASPAIAAMARVAAEDASSPLRGRANSTHNFGPGQAAPGSPEKSPVTDPGEARRQIMRRSSSNLAGEGTEAAAETPKPANAKAPAPVIVPTDSSPDDDVQAGQRRRVPSGALVRRLDMSNPVRCCRAGTLASTGAQQTASAHGSPWGARRTDDAVLRGRSGAGGGAQVLMSPTSKRVEVSVDASAVPVRVRDMGNSTSHEGGMDTVGVAAGASGGPVIVHRRTPSGGEVAAVVRPLGPAPSAPVPSAALQTWKSGSAITSNAPPLVDAGADLSRSKTTTDQSHPATGYAYAAAEAAAQGALGYLNV